MALAPSRHPATLTLGAWQEAASYRAPAVASGRAPLVLLEALLTPKMNMEQCELDYPTKAFLTFDLGEQSSDGSTTLGDDASSEPSSEEAEVNMRAESWLPHNAGDQLPSVGSMMHSFGKCEPCAWFWKPQGCEHGLECKRCHLCPAGEVKSRKKAKHAKMQVQQRVANRVVRAGQDAVARPMPSWVPLPPQAPEPSAAQTAQLPAFVSLPPRSGEVVFQATPAWESALNFKQEQDEQRSSASELRASFSEAHDLDLVGMNPAGHCVRPPPGLEAPETLPDSLPSLGAVLHSSGLCQPCAWFWKPQGCANGKECSRCHLCPEGEVKSRRRVKNAMMRRAGFAERGAELATATAPAGGF